MQETDYSRQHGRILMVALAFGAVATIWSVWWYYTRQREATEEATSQELAAIAAMKTTQIANWRRERIGDGRLLSLAAVPGYARRVLAGRATAEDRSALLDIMGRRGREFPYSGAVVSDLDGNVRLQWNTDRSDPAQVRELVRAAGPDDVQLSDLYLNAVSGRPQMALTIPVKGAGAVLLFIDPAHFLYPYVQSWPGPSPTAETMLVRIEGNELVYLSELRHVAVAPLHLRRSLSGFSIPAAAALEAGVPGEGPDYRGIQTLRVIRQVPDSSWILITKLDSAEFGAPLRRLSWEMAMAVCLIAFASATGVGFIWKRQQARVHEQSEHWFRSVANDTPAYLWMAGAAEQNSFINRPLSDFLGTSERRLAEDWTTYLHPDDAERVRTDFRDCVASRRDFNAEFRIRRFDGEYRWVVDRGVPRFSAKGEFLGFAGSLMDVTGRRAAEQQLRTANTVLAEQLEESLRKENEIESLSARLINAQEEERARLARELHDDLSQQIAALSMATGNLKRQIPPEQVEARAQGERIQQKLIQLSESIRRLSHQLHPAVLQHSGLAAAVRDYCDEFTTLTGVKVLLKTEGTFDGVAPPTALCLYRVAQEALQNVARHAHTPAAEVKLSRAGGNLQLQVLDRGIGMDPRRPALPAGLGLVSIKERTRLLNGYCEIQSSPDQGTTVLVTIPEARATGAV